MKLNHEGTTPKELTGLEESEFLETMLGTIRTFVEQRTNEVHIDDILDGMSEFEKSLVIFHALNQDEMNPDLNYLIWYELENVTQSLRTTEIAESLASVNYFVHYCIMKTIDLMNEWDKE